MNGGFRVAPVTFGGVAVPSQIVGEYRELEPGNPEYNVASAVLRAAVGADGLDGISVKIFKNGATYMAAAVVPASLRERSEAGDDPTMYLLFFTFSTSFGMMAVRVATTIQELFSLPNNLIYAAEEQPAQQRAADSQVFFPLEKNERIITPFRQAYNAGDVAGTVDQRTLEPASNQVNGIAPVNSLRKYERSRGAASGGKSLFTGNPRYVYDSSDYIRYRKLLAKNKNYNDVSFGGDQSNASQTAIMRHF